MTALEVLAATLLAALLMGALIGVLRGLKAHERTLDIHTPRQPWQRSLGAALEADLASGSTYQWSPQSLTLRGRGGRDENGRATWLPVVITYEIRAADESSWLVRRELGAPGGSTPRPDNLVMAGVTEIRVAPFTVDSANHNGLVPIESKPTAAETPLTDTLQIQFWGADRHAPLYSCQVHRL
jgi:hypothetical protein